MVCFYIPSYRYDVRSYFNVGTNASCKDGYCASNEDYLGNTSVYIVFTIMTVISLFLYNGIWKPFEFLINREQCVNIQCACT